MIKVNKPWEHFILSETFVTKDFISIQEAMLQWSKPEPGGRIREDILNQPSADFILHKLDKQIYPLLYEIALFDFSDTLLHQSNTKLIYKSEYNCQSKNHDYQVHTDAKCKLASIVTHISKYGTGTHLYGNDGSLHYTVPWKPNSSLLFTNGHKLHSFSSDYDYRVTLTSTLEIVNDSNFH
jgi:hypothetical protein